MKNRKTYIIADLVKLVGVARTTLNDWMVRYEQYIESEVRGHRRVYFDSSLNVLRDIAELRDAGKTSSEIQNELADRHPVNADIASEAGSGKKSLPAETDASTETLLPIVKQQAEEMERLLVRKLQDMAADLHQAQLDANHHSRQNARWILLVIVLLLIFGAGAVFTTIGLYDLLTGQQKIFSSARLHLDRLLSRNNDLFVTESKRLAAAAERQQLKFRDLAVMLEGDSKNSRQEIAALKAGIAGQPQAFAVLLDKRDKPLLEQHKANIELLKETFARERKALQEKIAELEKQNSQHKLTAQRQDTQIIELKKKIFELRAQLEAMQQEKARNPVPAVPPILAGKSGKTEKAPGKALSQTPDKK
ncbi:MAG: MerR family transcriptional regulator [Victivallaceae bacterium]|nr:MerR family transcriptional regulator [Victivallaceae bacterium]